MDSPASSSATLMEVGSPNGTLPFPKNSTENMNLLANVENVINKKHTDMQIV